MKFTPRHIVTMVACICAAAVLAPIGVVAASTFVSIVDPSDSSRRARVSSTQTLNVESRAGSIAGSFHRYEEGLNHLGGIPIYEAPYPYRVAITEFSVVIEGTSSNPSRARIYYRIRKSGTSTCQQGGSNWTSPVTLREITTNETEQMLFNGPPLVLPKVAAGEVLCVGVQQLHWWSGTLMNIGVIGYRFE